MSSSRPPTPSRLAAPVAQAILEAFADHRRAFLEVTRRAKGSFEMRDWARLREDSRRRLGLYRTSVDRAEAQTRVLLGERVRDRLVWVSAKAVYSALIAQRQDWDLAETFFNGVTRRIFDTVGVDPLIEFVASDFDAPPTQPEHRVYRRFTGTPSVQELVSRCLAEHELAVPWVDRAADARLVAERVEAKLEAVGRGRPVAFEVIDAPFFQGKGAYLVGRLVLPAGVVVPLVMALRNGPEGVFVDAVLTEENDVSILFSFTRSYFHIDAERPYDVMRFLRSLIPKKRIAELYIAIGEPKQGKTELYRAVMDHIEETRDTFGFAPGVPGLVMVVFTMPGMDVVMKVIRDEFPPEKQTSPAKVRERYHWVYSHDRAGRLVDAQEFEHLAFPKDRFEPELLEELLGECGRTVRVDGDRVIVELCYVERQLVPLNIYVRHEADEDAKAAAVEYGRAIEDLAACNIFPGDLLIKNFGVTRHGRVALYDYDELCELTEMNFRDMPEADSMEDEMRAEPWFAVGPRDVFPEEFPRFLGMPSKPKAALMGEVPEIFTASWWRDVQARVAEGKIVEFPPYPADRRLRGRFDADDED
ncbi:MAG TPA: bifunctional isocitrate dehydrogenase kinase/phosphatase [Sandaracinaceae bacterium LLY-WYZ-13_1]|nr:bifunctional isocitrate dehydrogenase kinase/phosphatase [Sandaracinaceae bacterium LLY-WYZ-13_1]